MALKIRLSRGGAKKRPFYRIVVAEASAPRDGRYVERLGHYNPMLANDNEQRLIVNGERVTHWLKQGAKPTERVQKLLAKLDLTTPVKERAQPVKSAPGKKRAEREAEEAAKAAEAEAAKAEAAPAEEATNTPSSEDAPSDPAVSEDMPFDAATDAAVSEDAPSEPVVSEDTSSDAATDDSSEEKTK